MHKKIHYKQCPIHRGGCRFCVEINQRRVDKERKLLMEAMLYAFHTDKCPLESAKIDIKEIDGDKHVTYVSCQCGYHQLLDKVYGTAIVKKEAMKVARRVILNDNE